MTSFEELTAASFQIIAAVGGARSCYIEAIHQAKAGDFEAARASIKQGDELYAEGHHAHLGLVQKEAAGDPTPMCLMLTHAEDQLMSAEGFGILAEEFVGVYESIHAQA